MIKLNKILKLLLVIVYIVIIFYLMEKATFRYATPLAYILNMLFIIYVTYYSRRSDKQNES